VQAFRSATEVIVENEIHNFGRWRLISTSGSDFDHNVVSGTRNASTYQILSKWGIPAELLQFKYFQDSRHPPSWIMNEVDSDCPEPPGSPFAAYQPNSVHIFWSTAEIVPENKIQNGGRWQLICTSGSGFDDKLVSG